MTHLLMDMTRPNRIAGAVGFNVRNGDFYVFRAKAVIVGAGGGSHIYRPRSVGEGMGRTWYAPWSTASAYGLLIPTGATMTQMENKIVLTRFKDGYGPVGAWFLLLKAHVTNAAGELYEAARFDEIKARVGKYAELHPMPTCLRNHSLIEEVKAGKGPIYMHTQKVLDTKEKEEIGWEDFLDMTIGQAVVWAAQNIDPKEKPSELITSEPYIMGSHATCSGAWASGPEDCAPQDYQWGYNRMTTVQGLFGAGDTIGGSAHKFSAGSFTEGRLAGKAAVRYVMDMKTDVPAGGRSAGQEPRADRLQAAGELQGRQERDRRRHRGAELHRPLQGLQRLEKLMDEYVGGYSMFYVTSEPLLNRSLELLAMLTEDFEHIGAENLHQLQRAWELYHRILTGEAVARHTLFRQETRWPGYYYRSDHPKLDDADWHVFTGSQYDAKTLRVAHVQAPGPPLRLGTEHRDSQLSARPRWGKLRQSWRAASEVTDNVIRRNLHAGTSSATRLSIASSLPDLPIAGRLELIAANTSLRVAGRPSVYQSTRAARPVWKMMPFGLCWCT